MDTASILKLDYLLKKNKVIALNDFFMSLVPCHRTSKLLSQLYYWSRANNHREFYRSQKMLMRDIGIQEGARMSLFRSMNQIRALGIFQIRQCTSPPVHRYKLDVIKLINILENAQS